MFSKGKLVLIIILLITFSITAYVVVVVIPSRLAEKSYEGARQIGRDINKLFHFTPRVTVNNTVVLEEQIPILELATVSQKFKHYYEWTHRRLGSTKKIRINGTFEAKAGFDLNKKFSIQINDDKAVITLPKSQLLSNESLGDLTFQDENGIWNWVNTEERAAAVNAYTSSARKYAEQGKFITDAQTSMEKKLTEILKLHGKQVEIRYSEGEQQQLNPPL